MRERGSTGASRSSTTRPPVSCRSRAQIVQFASPRTTSPASTAIALRTVCLRGGRPPADQEHADSEEDEPRAGEQRGLLEERRLERVVEGPEVHDERRDPESGE